MSNLFISTYLASARLDLCESLAEQHGFKIYHYNPEITSRDAQAWIEQYHFVNNRLPVRTILGHSWAVGLDSLICQERPDCVIVQEFSLITVQLIWLRRKYGYRLVSMCDDSLDMIQGNDFKWTHRMARRVIPRFLDNLILNSDETAGWYQNRFGKGLPLPIIPEESLFRSRLSRSRCQVALLREQYHLDSRKVILYVGRLVPLKNVGLLMRACASIKDRVRLIIVGSGEQEGVLREQSQEMGMDTVFAGACYGYDLLAWYAMADVFVLPSTQEAYGSVVGEALMAGCQVAVSSRAGSRALLTKGNGCVFDPKDVFALEEGLRTLLERPHSEASLCPVLFSESLKTLMYNLEK